MSTTPVASKPNRTPYFIIGGLVGCLILCACLVVVAGGAYVLFGKSTPVPVPNVVPTDQSNQPPAGVNNSPTPSSPAVDYSTYSGVGAPFAVKYPSDWTVDNEESASNLVTFVSPDQNASASISYGSISGTPDVNQAMDKFISGSLTNPQVVSKKTNADGSVTVEIVHTNQTLGGRVHGYLRLLIANDTYYFAQFNAVNSTFSQYQTIGKTMIDSLQVSP